MTHQNNDTQEENGSQATFQAMVREQLQQAAAFRNEGSCLLLFYAVIRSLHLNKLTMPASVAKQPDAEILHNH